MIYWLIFLAAIGVLVWVLTGLFPGQVDSDADWIYLIRTLAVLAFVSSGIVFLRRVPLGEVARNIAIWTAIAAVLMLGYTYQNELREVALRVRGELIPGYAVTTQPGVLRLTEGADRHFHVFATVNGVPVRFLIDTGASDIVLAPGDARRAGIDMAGLRFTRLYQTANGVGRGANTMVRSLSIGPLELTNLAVAVNEAEMGTSLLGMAFLRTLASVEIQGREMILRWN